MTAYVESRRAVAMGIFERAVARGEMRHDADPELLIDLISAFFWYRKLIRRVPIKRDGATPFVEAILRGIGVHPG
jgi:hypothetical protein